MYIANWRKSSKSVFFLISRKEVNFCGVLFCGFFILRELIFADRGQSAKIRNRKIFMLRGSLTIDFTEQEGNHCLLFLIST